MPENRMRAAASTVAYADEEKDKLVVEFAIPGAVLAVYSIQVRRVAN